MREKRPIKLIILSLPGITETKGKNQTNKLESQNSGAECTMSISQALRDDIKQKALF